MNPNHLSSVKRIVVVGSGKGGVGKSTISWYLAQSWRDMGLRVGLLDADVYGPSLPRLIGGYPKPEIVNSRMIPIWHDGFSCMSMGLVMPPDQAAVWRGPIIITAVKQMLGDVDWSAHTKGLDVLLIDLPPGTGDVPLTISQHVYVDGAALVTTHHPLSFDDATRAVSLYEKVGFPFSGVIYNMTSFVCPCCKTQTPLFGDLVHKDWPILGDLPIIHDESQWSQAIAPIAQAWLTHINL